MLESLLATMRAWFLPRRLKSAEVSETEKKLWALLVARLKDNRPALPIAQNRNYTEVQ